MTKAYHPLVFLLVITMLLCSACRSAHSMTKEKSTTQTSDSCRTSVAVESSFASIFHQLSLQADSIVLWFQDSDIVPAPDYNEDICSAYGDTVFTLPEVSCTAHRFSNVKPCAQPSLSVRTPSKVLIAGLQMKSQSTGQHQSNSLTSDSLSAREAHESSLAESQESKPPNSYWSLIFISILAIFIVLFAMIVLLQVRKHK